jgi:hypothetical protein
LNAVFLEGEPSTSQPGFVPSHPRFRPRDAAAQLPISFAARLGTLRIFKLVETPLPHIADQVLDTVRRGSVRI